MTRRPAPLLLVLVAGALASCAMVADWRASPGPPPPASVHSSNWKEPPKGYLPAGAHPDATLILPPPPAAGSPEQAADTARFEATRALQGTPRWTQAIRDADLSGKEAFQGFSCVAGVRIGPETTPTLSNMLLRMIDDARQVYAPTKAVYARSRPAAGNDSPVCVPRESWIETEGSYPSGHALIGYAWAMTLTELVPGRTKELTARGRAFGDSRAICGVHWQSDIDAGRMLAAPLLASLHADPGFQADLATARAEIEAARRLGRPERCPAG